LLTYKIKTANPEYPKSYLNRSKEPKEPFQVYLPEKKRAKPVLPLSSLALASIEHSDTVELSLPELTTLRRNSFSSQRTVSGGMQQGTGLETSSIVRPASLSSLANYANVEQASSSSVSTWRVSPQVLELSPETITQAAKNRHEEEEVYQDTEESDSVSTKEGASLFDAANSLPIGNLQIEKFYSEEPDVDETDIANTKIAQYQHDSDNEVGDLEDQTDQHSTSSSSVGEASEQISP